MDTVGHSYLQEVAKGLGINPNQSWEDLIYYIAWEQEQGQYIYQDKKGYYHETKAV